MPVSKECATPMHPLLTLFFLFPFYPITKRGFKDVAVKKLRTLAARLESSEFSRKLPQEKGW